MFGRGSLRLAQHLPTNDHSPPTRSHARSPSLSLHFTPSSFISGVGIGQQQYVYHWRWVSQGPDQPEEQSYVFVILLSTRLYTLLPELTITAICLPTTTHASSHPTRALNPTNSEGVSPGIYRFLRHRQTAPPPICVPTTQGQALIPGYQACKGCEPRALAPIMC